MSLRKLLFRLLIRLTGRVLGCHSCGVIKHADLGEVFKYPGCGILNEHPISPLFTLDCQPRVGDIWKQCSVCHACFAKLQPDMWINEEMWEGLKPVVPFDELPNLPSTNE